MRRVPTQFINQIFLLVAVTLQFTSCTAPAPTVWNFIPPSTIAVLENTLLQELKAQPLVATDFQKLHLPDSVNLTCTVVWLEVEKGRIEELFIIPDGSSLAEGVKNSFGAQVKPRKLNGYDFWELGTKDNSLSVLATSSLLAVSTNPLVIESVIRTLAQKQSVHPLAQLNKLPNLKQDKGNLYIDWTAIKTVWPLADRSILDVQSNKTTLMLDGFTLPDTASFSWQLLKSMEQQTPTPVTLQEVVPQGAHSLLHLGVSDASAWNATRLQLLQAAKPRVYDSLQAELKHTGFSANRFFAAIDHEIGVITLDRGTVVAVNIKEITKVDQELRKIRSAASEDESNLMFSESGPLIRYLFWPFAPDFREVHFALEGEVLYLANNQSALQFTLEKLALDQTWGRTLAWQKFHSAILTEANVSYFIAQPGANFVTAPLPDTFARGYAQFSNVGDQFYTSMLLEFARTTATQNTASKSPSINQLVFDRSIQSKPYPVINHNTKEQEIVFGDASGQFSLVSQNKIAWSLKVGSLASEVYQIDFFKNRKLQYAFVANQQLHIIDRLGRPVNGFPVGLAKGGIQNMSVVDYDQTRNYRYLITYANGEVWLLDARGKGLENWSPRKFGEEINAIRFQRMKGRDYFAALGRRTLYVVNRKGESVSGFPHVVDEDYANDFFADTQVGAWVVVTRSGKLQWIALNGTVAQEKILPKNSVEARFQLLPHEGHAFALRLDRGKVALFSLAGDLVFEVQNPGSNQLKAHVVLLQEKPHLILYDQEQQLVHVFGPTGNALLSRPLEASSEPGFSVTPEQAIQLHTVFGSQLSTTVIR
jgi:hypothetical protein